MIGPSSPGRKPHSPTTTTGLVRARALAANPHVVPCLQRRPCPTENRGSAAAIPQPPDAAASADRRTPSNDDMTRP
jgi:hypothetical protein